MKKPRLTWEMYTDVIEMCPEIFTRIIQTANIANKTAKDLLRLGLIKRELGPGPRDTLNTRKQVYWVYATEKGKKFAYHLREIQKLLR